MTFSFLPNSIVNNAANPADYESPYSFLAFIQYQDFKTIDVNIQFKEYQEYINAWGNKKSLKKSQQNLIVRDAYVNLMREITLNFATEEEKRFILNADLNEDSDLDIVIPFFIQKLKQISFYYNSKRQEVKNSLVKHNLKGSEFGIETIVRNLIYEYVETKLDTRRKKLSSFYDNFDVSVTELYGDSEQFYDKPKNSIYTITNEIDPNIFINFKQSIIDAISAYPVYLQTSKNSLISNFTTNLKLSGNEYEYLKNRDFIDYIKGEKENLKLNLFKNLYPKFTGTDYYYISTNSNNQILSGVLFKSENFNGQYLNKHFPTTILSEPLDTLYSSFELGSNFIAQNQGFLIYNVPDKNYHIDKQKISPNNVYIFPNPSEIGNTIYTSDQENDSTPIVYSVNLEWNRCRISDGYRLNDVLSNNYNQLFFAYQSKEQNIKQSIAGISKINDNITFWGGEKNQTWEGSFNENFYPIDQDSKKLLYDEGVAVDWYADEFNNEFALYKKINTYRKKIDINFNDSGIIPDSDTEVLNLSTNNVSLYEKKSLTEGKIFVRNNFYNTTENIVNALSTVFTKYPKFVVDEIESRILSFFLINNIFVIETKNYVISDNYLYNINDNSFSNNSQPFYLKKERVLKNLDTFVNPWYDEKYKILFLVFLKTIDNSLSGSNYKYISPEIYSTKINNFGYKQIYPTESTVTTIYSLSSPYGVPPEINLVEYSGGVFRKNSPLNEFNLTYMAKNPNSLPFIINEKLIYTPQNNTFISEYPLLLKPFYFIYDNNYSNIQMPHFVRYASNKSGYIGLKKSDSLNFVTNKGNETNYTFSSNIDVLQINECGNYIIQFDWESYNDSNVFIGCSSLNVKRVSDNLLLNFNNKLIYLSSYNEEKDIFNFELNEKTFLVKAIRPTYPYNEILTITVKTSSGDSFSGTFCGESIYRKIKIVKTGVGFGQVIADPACINCGDNINECEYLYPLNSTITLIASAGPYSRFVVWGGDSECVGTNADCILKVDDDKTIFADFDLLPIAFLSVDSGLGRVVSFDGNINCPVKCFSPYPQTSYITLSASPAPEGYYFKGFRGIPCSEGSRVCTFIIYSNLFAEAIYSKILLYDLNVSISNETYGDFYLLVNTPLGEKQLTTNNENLELYINRSSKGSIKYKNQYDTGDTTCIDTCKYPSLSENTLVSLTAIPEVGYVFDKWIGGPCDGSSDNVCIFEINKDESIIANFKIPSYTVKIINVGDGIGRTYSEPYGIDCIPFKSDSVCSYEFLSGTQVTVYAYNSAGSNYFGLSSNQIGNTESNSLSFIISENVVISANYEGIVYYDLSLNKNGINAGQFFTEPQGINCSVNCTNALNTFLENSRVVLNVNLAPNRQVIYYETSRPVIYNYVAGNGISIVGNTTLRSQEFFEFLDDSFIVNNASNGVPYVQGDDKSLIIDYRDIIIDMTDNININSFMI